MRRLVSLLLENLSAFHRRFSGRNVVISHASFSASEFSSSCMTIVHWCRSTSLIASLWWKRGHTLLIRFDLRLDLYLLRSWTLPNKVVSKELFAANSNFHKVVYCHCTIRFEFLFDVRPKLVQQIGCCSLRLLTGKFSLQELFSSYCNMLLIGLSCASDIRLLLLVFDWWNSLKSASLLSFSVTVSLNCHPLRTAIGVSDESCFGLDTGLSFFLCCFGMWTNVGIWKHAYDACLIFFQSNFLSMSTIQILTVKRSAGIQLWLRPRICRSIQHPPTRK